MKQLMRMWFVCIFGFFILVSGCTEQADERARMDRKFDDLMEEIQSLSERVSKIESSSVQTTAENSDLTDTTAEKSGRAALKQSLENNSPNGSSAEEVVTAASFRSDETEKDDPALGDAQAPITMFIFSGFECDRCRDFFQKSLPRLQKKYVEENTLRIVLRDFPLPHHRDGMRAAETAQCLIDRGVAEKGNYWTYFDKLITRSDLSGDLIPNTLTPDERARVSRCIKVEKYRGEIEEDRASGAKLGVVGIPTVFIVREIENGRYRGVKIRGAQPLAVYEKAIRDVRDLTPMEDNR